MKLDRTPWVRQSMTDDETGTLRVMLPDEYRLDMSKKLGGPFRAQLYFGQRCISAGADSTSPYQAGIKAVSVAAGEYDEDALRRQLVASLLAIGVDPSPELDVA